MVTLLASSQFSGWIPSHEVSIPNQPGPDAADKTVLS